MLRLAPSVTSPRRRAQGGARNDEISSMRVTRACHDTPGWKNQYGSGCKAYKEDGRCRNGEVMEGQEWSTGYEFKNPEEHCCECGGGGAGGAPCQDTYGWHNKYGTTCHGYESEGNCAGGHVLPGREWTLGPEYNHPEENCCACYGK